MKTKMKKAMATETVIIIVLAIVALLFFIYLGWQQLELGKSAGSFLFPSCPKDVKITFECPCAGDKISSGYCCDSGASQKPCLCVERNVIICADYETKEECLKDECGLKPGGNCIWYEDVGCMEI